MMKSNVREDREGDCLRPRCPGRCLTLIAHARGQLSCLATSMRTTICSEGGRTGKVRSPLKPSTMPCGG